MIESRYSKLEAVKAALLAAEAGPSAEAVAAAKAAWDEVIALFWGELGMDQPQAAALLAA